MLPHSRLFQLPVILTRSGPPWALLALAVLAVVAHPVKAKCEQLGKRQVRTTGSVVNPLKCQPFVILYRMDRAGNNDGILDPHEIPRGAESFVQRLVSESKVNVTRTTSLKQVAVAWHRRAPRTAGRALKSCVIQREPSPSPHGKSEASHHDHAMNFLRLYDQNSNGSLEPSEWSRIGGDWHETDSDLDGVLSPEELSSRFLAYGQSASAPETCATPPEAIDSAADSPRRSALGQHRPKTEEPSRRRRSYRRRTPHERLPAGIPDWYIEKDADRDGQIMMAEFARTWDDEKLAAFQRFDSNDDGVITPRECLATEAQQRPGLGQGK